MYNSAPDYKGFMQDFAIADMFGEKAVRDTYKRAKREWKKNPDYFASLIMTLNHRLWYHYENGREGYARLYDELWRDADDAKYRYFKGDALQGIIAFLD